MSGNDELTFLETRERFLPVQTASILERVLQDPRFSPQDIPVNTEADRIIEEGRTEFDREKRAAMYRRFHRILHEEQPYTFLFNRNSLVALDRRFENVAVYPLGPDTTEWWVPADRQRYR